MQRSGSASIIVTALIGLIVTPVAIGLITYCGKFWYSAFNRNYGLPQSFPPAAIGPTLAGIAGLVLLAGVIVTSRWSPAGLLAAGALGIISLIFSLIPLTFHKIFTSFDVIPISWFDGIYYGLAQPICVAMGAMGLVRLQSRPIAPVQPVMRVLAVVGALVLIPLGIVLATQGMQLTLRRSLQLFQERIDPVGALLLAVGAVVLIAGVLLSRWSAAALIAPAVVLLVATAVMFTTARLYLPSNIYYAAGTLLTMGGAVALAVILMTFTVVLMRRPAPPSAQTWAPQTPPQQPGMFTFPAASGR